MCVIALLEPNGSAWHGPLSSRKDAGTAHGANRRGSKGSSTLGVPDACLAGVNWSPAKSSELGWRVG